MNNEKRGPVTSKKQRRMQSKWRKIGATALIASLVLGSTNIGSLSASEALWSWFGSDSETTAIMEMWINTSEADKASVWETLSEYEREVIWSNADENGNINVSNMEKIGSGNDVDLSSLNYDEYTTTVSGGGEVSNGGVSSIGLEHTHSGTVPSWCQCHLTRNIVINDDTYVNTFENVLAPIGEPNMAMQLYFPTRPATNQTTKTWNFETGHLVNFGFYGARNNQFQVLDTNHTTGYIYDGVGTQTVSEPSVYLNSRWMLYWDRVSNNTTTDQHTQWSTSQIGVGLNGAKFYTAGNNFTVSEKSAVVNTQYNAITSYYGDTTRWQLQYKDTGFSAQVAALSVREYEGYYSSLYDMASGHYKLDDWEEYGHGDDGSYWEYWTRTYYNNLDKLSVAAKMSYTTNHSETYPYPSVVAAQTARRFRGTRPALNLNLASISLVSGAGIPKSGFDHTEYAGYYGDDDESTLSRTWDLTLQGGTGFSATPTTSDVITPGQSITVDIDDLGILDSATAYTQLSAVLVDTTVKSYSTGGNGESGLVVMYGKVGEITDGQVTITIPEHTWQLGTYAIKVFAEEVNSVSGGELTHKTDYASNMVTVGTVQVDSTNFDFEIEEESDNISLVQTADGYSSVGPMTIPNHSHIGNLTEAGYVDGEWVDATYIDGGYIYQADPGYYFTSSYSALGTCNGITVAIMPGDDTKLIVYGIIEDNTKVVLPDPTPFPYTVTFEEQNASGQWVEISGGSYEYNVTTAVDSITIPEGPVKVGENFKYWVLSGGDAFAGATGGVEDRIYAGDKYDQKLASAVYRPFYGPITSTLIVDVNLDSDANDYGFNRHGQRISLYLNGVEKYWTDGPDQIVQGVNRGVIIDIENNVAGQTYDLYIGGYSAGVEVEIFSSVDFTEYEVDAFFYTTTFDYADGETDSVEQYILNGWYPTTPDAPDNSRFLGWALDGTTTIVDPTQVQIDRTIKFIAQYEAQRYQVSFVDKDGVLVEYGSTYETGTALGVPPGPAVDGQTFSYWQEEGGNLRLDPNTDTIFYVLAKDIVFVPVYGQNTSTVILDLYLDGEDWETHGKIFTLVNTVNGSSIGPANSEDTILAVGNGEWEVYMNGNPIGKYIEIAATTATGNVVTETLEFFTVTYNYNNDTSPGYITQQVLKNKNSVAPANPVKTGHTFVQWDNPGTNITAPRTINAQYTTIAYNVQFQDGAGNTIFNENVDFNSLVSPPLPSQLATPDGKMIDYWVSDDIYTTIVDPYGKYTVVARAVVFIPIFKDVSATVQLSVLLDHGTWDNHGKTFALKSISTGISYPMSGVENIFVNIPAGNYTVVELIGSTTFDTKLPVVVDGLSSTVVSTPLNYFTVRYLDDFGGTPVCDDQIVYTGQNVVAPNVTPTKEGYTNTGWIRDNYNITNTEDIYPNYVGNNYKITFKDWDGTILQESSQVAGTNIDVPSNPSREHYVFTGWSPSVNTTVPTRDQIYVAQYEVDVNDPPSDDDDGSNPPVDPDPDEPDPDEPDPDEPDPDEPDPDEPDPDEPDPDKPDPDEPNPEIVYPEIVYPEIIFPEINWDDFEWPDFTCQGSLCQGTTCGGCVGGSSSSGSTGTTSYPSTTYITNNESDDSSSDTYNNYTEGDENTDGTQYSGATFDKITSGDTNGNGIPDNEEDLDGNGIPDYLEGKFVAGTAQEEHSHFSHFLFMVLLLAVEWMWIFDRSKRQATRLDRIERKRRRLIEEEKLLEELELYERLNGVE